MSRNNIHPQFLIDQSEKPRWNWVKDNWIQYCLWPTDNITTKSFTHKISQKAKIPFKFLRYIKRYVQRDGRIRLQIYLPTDVSCHYFGKISSLFPLCRARKHIEVRKKKNKPNARETIVPDIHLQNHNFSLITWNCCGITKSLKQTLLKDHLNDISVVCLQETLRSQDNIESAGSTAFLEKWTIFERAKENEKHKRGLMTAVNTSSNPLIGWSVEEIKTDSLQETTIFIKLTPPIGINNPPIIVGNVYIISQSDGKKANYNLLHSTLRKIFNDNQGAQFIIMGDFNTPSKAMTDIMEPFHREVKFCPIMSQQNSTFIPFNTSRLPSTIDHVFASNTLQAQVSRMDDLFSDHFGLKTVCKINVPQNFNSRRIIPSKVIGKLKEIRDCNYFAPLAEIGDSEIMVRSFQNAVHKCATDLELWASPPSKPKSRLSQTSKSILKKKQRAIRAFQEQRSQENANALREINSQLRKSISTDNTINSINRMIEETEPLLLSSNVIDSWKSILRNFNVGKASSKGSSQRRVNILDPAFPDKPLDPSREGQSRLWTQFYEATFGRESILNQPSSHLEWKDRLDDNSQLDEIDQKYRREITFNQTPSESLPLFCAINAPIRWREVAKHIRRLGERKTPGEDAIVAEIFKSEIMNTEEDYDFTRDYPSSNIGRAIFQMVKLIWNDEKVPDDLKVSIIAPIPKIPNPLLASDYRPISLIPVAIKLITSIMAKRILKSYNSRFSKSQAGFRSKEECIGQIIALHDTIRWSQLQQKDTYVCLIDIKQAFDSVPHIPLQQAIYNFGIRGKMFNLIKDMYTNSKCKVRLNNNEYSDDIPIARGVKQGDPLSPILFIIFMESLVKTIDDRKIGVDIGENINLSNLLYADDIALISNSAENLQYMMDLTSNWLDKRCMKANPKKCGILAYHRDPKQKLHPIPPFFIQGEVVDRVEKYKYLGIEFDEKLSFETMAQTRVEKANSVLNACRHKLLSNQFPLRTKILIIKSIIIPTLTYGCALWGTDKAAQKSAHGVIQKAVSAAFGQKNINSATIISSGVKTMKEITYSSCINLFCRSEQKSTWLPEIIQWTRRDRMARSNSRPITWSEKLEKLCFQTTEAHIPLEYSDKPKDQQKELISGFIETLFPPNHSLPLEIDLMYLSYYSTSKSAKDVAKTTQGCSTFRRSILEGKEENSKTFEELDIALENYKKFINNNYMLTTGVKHCITMMSGDFWQGARNFKTVHTHRTRDTTPVEERETCIHCNTGHVETISHMLRDCPAWNRQRKIVWNRIILSDYHMDKLLKVLHRVDLETDNYINRDVPFRAQAMQAHELSAYEKYIKVLSTTKDALTQIACYMQLIHPRRANQRRISMKGKPKTKKINGITGPNEPKQPKVTDFFAKKAGSQGDNPVGPT